MNFPLVSVLICSYNAEKFIGATLRSVLNQTYANLEVLVLDNGSRDETVGVVEGLQEGEPRLRLYAGKENLGAYGGLNYLLERAAGKYIAINDHDDIWHRDKIKRQVEFLDANTGWVGCGTAIVNHYERHDVFVVRRQPEISNVAWHTSLVYKKSEACYDASLKVATDFHFMKHILCSGGKLIYNLPEPYVLRRLRADGTNLSDKWIHARNAGHIVRADIGWFDKICLINRLFMPGRLLDYLLVKVFLKRAVISREAMKHDPVMQAYF
jgi:glycosyltransferase involved in cell wall biosynthesis